MKFKLRFFLSNKNSDEEFCFATVHSAHVPGVGSRVFLRDEAIVDKKVDTGYVYKVKERVFVYRVFVYNNYGKEDDLTSVEITVTRINK